MLAAAGDSLSDFASSDDGEDGEEDHGKETQKCNFSVYNEPGWLMGKITQTVQQCMERLRQNVMAVMFRFSAMSRDVSRAG